MYAGVWVEARQACWVTCIIPLKQGLALNLRLAVWLGCLSLATSTGGLGGNGHAQLLHGCWEYAVYSIFVNKT